MHALDTGVILCRLSMAIEERAREAWRQGVIKEVSHALSGNRYDYVLVFLSVYIPRSFYLFHLFRRSYIKIKLDKAFEGCTGKAADVTFYKF